MPEAVRLRAMAALTIRAQDEERARVARELHECIAQQVAALGYQLSAAARDCTDAATATRLHALREHAGDILHEVQSMANAMHSTVLRDLGLPAALEWLSRTTEEQDGLGVHLHVSDDPGSNTLPDALASVLFRVAQESIRNVVRHAAATRAEIQIAFAPQAVLLEVSDDGCGFDVTEATVRRQGMGLFVMRERLALVGGMLEIATARGGGTRIRATVPLSKQVEHSPVQHDGV